MWESLHTMGNHHHRVTKMPYQEVEEDLEEEEAVAAAFTSLNNIAHFTPFSNVRPRDLAKNAPGCTNLLSFSALLAIVKDKDTSFRRREVATREDPPFQSVPLPQNRKLPYHPWKPFIIIVIAHIIIAKKEVSLIAVQLWQDKRKDFEQKWSGFHKMKNQPDILSRSAERTKFESRRSLLA